MSMARKKWPSICGRLDPWHRLLLAHSAQADFVDEAVERELVCIPGQLEVQRNRHAAVRRLAHEPQRALHGFPGGPGDLAEPVGLDASFLEDMVASLVGLAGVRRARIAVVAAHLLASAHAVRVAH